MFIATIGYGIGLDASFFRIIAAMMLIGIGVILLVPAAADAIRGGRSADQRLEREQVRRHRDRRPLGTIRAWPAARRRVEPLRRTDARRGLGARSAGQNLGQVAFVMLAFGFGAALPLLLLGRSSRETLLRWRSRLLEAGKGGKTAARRAARRCRPVHRHGARQAARNAPRRGFARVADRADDAFLGRPTIGHATAISRSPRGPSSSFGMRSSCASRIGSTRCACWSCS